MKKIILLCSFVLMLPAFKVRACSPMSVPNLLNQSVSGNNLLLDWQSTNVWICPGYSVQVEITCFNGSFTGTGPFFMSPNLDKTVSLAQAYPQQTISLSSFCPGKVYQFRAREVEMGGFAFSPWTTISTFTMPGVYVQPALAVTSNSSSICSSQTVQLTASVTGGCSNILYNWQPTIGLSCSSCSNPVASPSVSTIYTCTVNDCDINGTSQVVSVNVGPGLLNGYPITYPNAICLGDSATLILNVAGTPTIQWQTSTNGASPWSNLPGANSISYTANALQNSICFRALYTKCSVTHNSAVGCVNVLTVSLTATADSNAVCAGTPVNLNASGASSYTWSGVGVGASISVTPAITTTYTVIGANNIGCSDTASVAQVVNLCTGILQQSLNNDVLVNIYPNPNNGEFIVNSADQLVIKLLNELGQVCAMAMLNENNHYALHVQLPAGIYLLVAQSNQGALTYKKVSVTR